MGKVDHISRHNMTVDHIDTWIKKVKSPTSSFSFTQIVWIILQGLVSSGICFGVVFGISVEVYKNLVPTLWYFPVPIAGHLGLLAICVTLINWVLCGILQTLDILNGFVPPLHASALIWWPQEDSTLSWWLNTSDLVIEPQSYPKTSWSKRIICTLVRSVPWILLSFIIFWPIFVGTCSALWGNNEYNSNPQPEYITATFAAVIALFTVPVWAVITATRVGCLMDIEGRSLRTSNIRIDSLPL